jgi:hypothetical protein
MEAVAVVDTQQFTVAPLAWLPCEYQPIDSTLNWEPNESRILARYGSKIFEADAIPR